MRILFINSIQMFGGGEIWMLRTLAGLKARGHQVHLICRPGTELEKRAMDAGVQVYSIPIRGDFGPLSIYRTWKCIRDNKIDIVLTNMDKELRFGGIAARLAGHCAVFPRRGIDYPLKNKPHYRFAYTKLADAVIANSAATKRALLKNAPWLPEHKVRIVYNGIVPDAFMTPPAHDLRKDWGIPNNEFVFGFVGQLDERKGLHTLLPAFASLTTKAHLVLVGEGVMDREIDEFTHKHGLDRLHRVGFSKDIENVMKAIDCLILPSLWEGFGIVLIEAMAAGKPAITTNVSSMPEIVVDNETGIVVPVSDEAALTRAMQRIVEDPKQSAEWGTRGRERVLQHFTLKQMLNELERVFTETLSAR